ncbi:SEC14-like protein 2 [Trichonephila clavipes]|nr:SEC14-like protein 2 [Trichonephila clavipes]
MTWLEDMTAEELEIVEELKKRTIKDATPKMLEDESVFYRFCKARDFNIEEAETMLRKHITWRKELHVDTISTDYKPPEVFVKYLPTSVMGFDKEGCVVRYCDFGNSDVKGLHNSATKEDHLKFAIYMLENDTDLLIQHNKEFGKKAIHGIHIYNFENVTLSKATHKKSIEMSLEFCQMFQDNYPERVKLIYHINDREKQRRNVHSCIAEAGILRGSTDAKYALGLEAQNLSFLGCPNILRYVTGKDLPAHLLNFPRAFGDGPRNFELWSSDEDDTSAGTPSPNYHTTPTRGHLSSRQI